MVAVKGSVGTHKCPACLRKDVQNKYVLCFGCERKWWKVYGDCCRTGMPEAKARDKADAGYPGRYGPGVITRGRYVYGKGSEVPGV